MSESASTVAAVRGAIQVAANRAELVQSATARLLTELLERNAVTPARIVSAIFTATPDLDADFPAHAARKLGWTDVPLLGAVEIAVPGALPRVVRVLLTVSGVPAGKRLTPVYLDGAAALRPDLASRPSPSTEPDGTDARTIAIIGLGQIGGSIGLALGGNRRWRRVGFDLDLEVAERARSAGALEVAAPSLEAACREADLAVIAVPVDVLPAVVRAAAAALPRGGALVDTGSARAGVTEALRDAVERGVRAIGGHPLAGNEGRGFDSARATLFERERWVLCPVREEEPPPIVRAMIADLGAIEVIVDAAAHDAALARTSHLPYVIARAFREIARGPEAAGLFGPAFRGLTRVASSEPRVAEAYCRKNLPALSAAWESLRRETDLLLLRLAEGVENRGLDSAGTGG